MDTFMPKQTGMIPEVVLVPPTLVPVHCNIVLKCNCTYNCSTPRHDVVQLVHQTAIVLAKAHA